MIDEHHLRCVKLCRWQVLVLSISACAPLPPAPLERTLVAESTAREPVTESDTPESVAPGQSRPAPSTSGSSDSVVSIGEIAAQAEDNPKARSARDVISSTAPAAISPPFLATAMPDDGKWSPFGVEGGDGPLFWRTALHPNERSRFISVSAVAIDLKRFRLEWVVGTGDVGAETLIGKQLPGLVNDAWAAQVVAVFNGGFQARHGYWGQVSHGVTLVKPKDDGCGIALYADGRVAFGRYEARSEASLVTYRQAPPCLVEGGTVNARLASGLDAVWAGNGAREKTRRRSAVGLTADQRTMFYVVGVETEPLDLARALKALGVEVGLQLDINWNWTRFFLLDRAAGSANLGLPLLEGMVADKGEYLRRPSKRDFFAILRRSVEQ